MKIAGNLTINEWQALEKLLDESKSDNWDKAFDFFEQRTKTRYLNPIKTILDMDLNTGEGFAVVNLQCSLIETIECFYNGWVYNHPNYVSIDGTGSFRGNEKIFESFFKEREPFKSLAINGRDFYSYVRCGLLHETQTKAGWLIKAEDNKIYEEIGSEKIIYRTNFQQGIEDVIKQYKADLSNSANAISLRRNFKEKFNHICKISI